MKTLLQVLSADERAQVHEQTLRVLATIGMRVDSVEGRRILADAGGLVAGAPRICRFPPALVEQALAAAPRDFVLGGRRPGWRFPMNAGECTLLASGGATMVLDRVTGEQRQSTHEDWLQSTLLIDALDEVGLYWAMVSEGSGDDSVGGWVAYNIELMRSFSKHVQDSFFDPGWAPWLLEVLQIVFGGRDELRRLHPYSFLVTPASPLIIEHQTMDAWLALRGWDIPVAVMPMPLMGATAPGSKLATVLLANCETIGTLCLVQAADPGAPFIYAPILASMDPRSGRHASDTAHTALSAAGVEMARFYGLPVIGSTLSVDPWVPGIQSGYETGVGFLGSTLPWPDVLLGPGTIAGALVMSFEQLLVDVEIFRMARHAHRGIEVSDDRWLTDVLERVGPGGSFIGERSTRTNARAGEWFLPQLGMHDPHHTWVAAGRPDVLDEARERVATLLAAHEPLPLGDDVERELGNLLKRARHEG